MRSFLLFWPRTVSQSYLELAFIKIGIIFLTRVKIFPAVNILRKFAFSGVTVSCEGKSATQRLMQCSVTGHWALVTTDRETEVLNVFLDLLGI